MNRVNPIARPRQPVKRRSRSSSPDKKESSHSMSPNPRNSSPRRRSRRNSRDRSPRRRRYPSPRSRYRFRSRSPVRGRHRRSSSRNSDDSRGHQSRATTRRDEDFPRLINANTLRNLNQGERDPGQMSDERPRFHGAEGDTTFTHEDLKNISVDIRRTIPADLLSNNRPCVNPQDIVLVRRPGEGLRPLFDREELKSAGPVEERRVISKSPSHKDNRQRRNSDLDRSSGRDRRRLDTRFPIKRRSRTRSRSRERRRTRSPGHSRREPTHEEMYQMPAVIPAAPMMRPGRPYPIPVIPYGAIPIRRPFPQFLPRRPFPPIMHPRFPMYYQYPPGPRMYPPHYRMP